MWSIRTKESNGSAPTAASRPRVTAFLLRIHQWRDLSEALIRKSPHFPGRVSPTAGSEVGRAGHLPPADPGESQKGEERRAEQSRGITTLSSAGSEHWDNHRFIVTVTVPWFPGQQQFQRPMPEVFHGSIFLTLLQETGFPPLSPLYTWVTKEKQTKRKLLFFPIFSYISYILLSYFLGFNWA